VIFIARLRAIVTSYHNILPQWICEPLMFPWLNHRKAVAS